MEPVIARSPALTVVGLEAPFVSALSPDATNAKVIGPLWSRFAPRANEVANRAGHDMVGVIYSKAPEQRSHAHELQYIAGSPVSRLPRPDELPPGMTAHTVPETTFAMFTHRGPIDRLQQTLEIIYRQWLPHSGYRHSGIADVEVYGCQFVPAGADSEMGYWISIVPTTARP